MSHSTLRHCAELLKPGGPFVVNEGLATAAFAQITFGMTDGWWLFGESRDPERVGQESPLLSWRQWEALLADSGFSHSHRMQSSGFLRGQAVIVAQTATASTASKRAVAWGRDAAHFFSGGLGGLGLLTARWLAQRGSHSVLLASRGGALASGMAAACALARIWARSSSSFSTLGRTAAVAF